LHAAHLRRLNPVTIITKKTTVSVNTPIRTAGGFTSLEQISRVRVWRYQMPVQIFMTKAPAMMIPTTRASMTVRIANNQVV
jgi:hypothetical protein